ncbi:MAG: GNAT family N-acetyltransferase, partial [Candidatus Heimdallarchaeota archaeon]|nr:GNAT family N-acetyltransferase [Candidatus Heimdallarchaeota archaeon]
MRIIKFDTHKASDELYNLFFELTEKLGEEKRPGEAPPPRALLRRMMTTKIPEVKRYWWLVLKKEVEKERAIGIARIGFSTKKDPAYQENKHNADIRLDVEKEYRKKGIGSEALKVLIEKAKEDKYVNTLLVDVNLDSGHKFCKKLGGDVALEAAENRLHIKEVNWSMIEQWKNDGDKIATQEGVSMHFFTECPEDILAEYVDIYTETINQQPLGEVDMEMRVTTESRRLQEEQLKKQGLKWFTKITREKDSKISGLTEFLQIPEMPERIMQLLTGVKKEYRGRGLGKWLKADML